VFAVVTAVLGVAFGAQNAAAPAAAPAQPNPNCTLRVPAEPLSSAGLATPYQLTATDRAQGACHEANANQSAFVQATVLDPATGRVFVYNPLVVDRGTRPAAAPVVPRLPAHAVVGIWFGFNGTTLTLSGPGAGSCVNGLRNSPFGQFAYCDAPAFFRAANSAERAGKLTVPALGTARDGRACPTTRDFGLVDQDQSDNVTSEYVADRRGRTAQSTAAVKRRLGAATTTTLLNGSDNLLLDAFVDPALGCTPWTAPDLANPGHSATSLALDELQAAKDQQAPVALVPRNDPMALVGNAHSTAKTDLYRAGVDQPPLGGADNGSPTRYCSQLATLGAQRIALDQQFTVNAPSPQAGQNLFDFLTQRLAASLTNLNCPQAATPTPTAAPAAPSPTATHRGDQAPTAMPATPTAPTATAPTATASAPASATAAPSATPSATPPPPAPTGAAAPTLAPPTSAGPTVG
jgi:hypothetical protein